MHVNFSAVVKHDCFFDCALGQSMSLSWSDLEIIGKAIMCIALKLLTEAIR